MAVIDHRAPDLLDQEHTRRLIASLAEVGLEIVPLRRREAHEFLPHANSRRNPGCARCPWSRGDEVHS
jgi:hypothetical protein